MNSTLTTWLYPSFIEERENTWAVWQPNLNQCNMNIILHMRISLMNILLDEVTKFTTEFNSCWTASNYNTVQEPPFLFLSDSCFHKHLEWFHFDIVQLIFSRLDMSCLAHLTASGLAAISCGSPERDKLHEERSHVLLHPWYQTWMPLLQKQLLVCRMKLWSSTVARYQHLQLQSGSEPSMKFRLLLD